MFEGALGFNRLSIIDLSERGHQPMCNDDRERHLGVQWRDLQRVRL